MREMNPPLLATWMLEHIAPGPGNEALAGDLLEEFRQGRSVGWYWRQILAAIAIALSNVILSRIAAMVFTTAWCTVVPAWLLAITGVEAHFNLHQRFWQMDWPWSFVCDWGLLLLANLAFIWTGIVLYLISSLGSTGNLSLRSLGRGMLSGLPALATLSAALVVLPGMFIQLQASRQGLPGTQPILNGRIDIHIAAILVRLPFFLAILTSIWGATSRPRKQRAGMSG
jgi:hypothetical protein